MPRNVCSNYYDNPVCRLSTKEAQVSCCISFFPGYADESSTPSLVTLQLPRIALLTRQLTKADQETLAMETRNLVTYEGNSEVTVPVEAYLNRHFIIKRQWLGITNRFFMLWSIELRFVSYIIFILHCHGGGQKSNKIRFSYFGRPRYRPRVVIFP